MPAEESRAAVFNHCVCREWSTSMQWEFGPPRLKFVQYPQPLPALELPCPLSANAPFWSDKGAGVAGGSNAAHRWERPCLCTTPLSSLAQCLGAFASPPQSIGRTTPAKRSFSFLAPLYPFLAHCICSISIVKRHVPVWGQDKHDVPFTKGKRSCSNFGVTKVS